MQYTPSEFNLAIEGYFNGINEANRAEWERQRWTAVNLLNAWLKNPIKKVQDLAVFEWEKDVSGSKPLSKMMTPEARERLIKAMDKF